LNVSKGTGKISFNATLKKSLTEDIFHICQGLIIHPLLSLISSEDYLCYPAFSSIIIGVKRRPSQAGAPLIASLFA